MKGLYLIIFILPFIKSEEIVVTIPDGALKGSTFTDYDGGLYYGFRKIPFAKPPIDKLRFKEAVVNEPWTDILDATQISPHCRQPNEPETTEIGQEDCLYLNVYTPYMPGKKDDSSLKPVLVFIHGGKFYQGSGSDFGPDYIITQDLVVVMINYRLGLYGFMNTVNSKIASDIEQIGNNGFKDQLLALKWVQSNIQYFGGDPGQVTISGESAGAMSVHAHVLSPLSTDLFHRAIVMSGTTIVPMILIKNDTATSIAEYLGFNCTDYQSMISDLQQTSNDDLFKASKALKWFQIQLNQLVFNGLIIEQPTSNSFISDYPLNLIKSGNYSKVPLMIGTTNREGLLILGSEEFSNDISTHIPFFFENSELAIQKIKKFYNIESNDTLVNFFTDIWFKYNTFRAAAEHSRVQDENIYYYEFAGDAKLNFLKHKLPGMSEYYGACHADELCYLFQCGEKPEKNSLEEKLMRNVVKLWANFVKTGQPLDELKPFKDTEHNFVNITNNGLNIGVINEKSFEFWDSMYDSHCNGPY